MTKQGRPCAAMHPVPQPKACRICWLFVHDARYRDRWLGVKVKQCVHLGNSTGQQVECTSCLGKKQVDIHQCNLHGVCTVADLPNPSVILPCCRICPDRKLEV